MNRALTPLTNDQLMERIPSAFNNERHPLKTTAKYQHISTATVIEGLRQDNFLPFWAQQTRSKHERFTKHIIRFRRGTTAFNPQMDDVFPEVILINSHDGSSAYKLMAGMWRVVCSNGLIVGQTYAEC